MDNKFYLNTGALEINRWNSNFTNENKPISINISDWIEAIIRAGFDGIELWENHAVNCSEDEQFRQNEVLNPVAVFNSYVDFNEPLSIRNRIVANRINTLNCQNVKYGLPKSIPMRQAADNLCKWCTLLDDNILLCNEFHKGNWGETAQEALELLNMLPTDRFKGMFHLGAPVSKIKQYFDVIGERITHCHAVLCRFDAKGVLDKSDITRVTRQLDFLRDYGYTGSFTIEFVTGAGVIINDVLLNPEARMSFRYASSDLKKIKGYWEE
jgi:sugar phosphate isomerase/epimerase